MASPASEEEEEEEEGRERERGKKEKKGREEVNVWNKRVGIAGTRLIYVARGPRWQ